jgi:hypothetical protein
MDVGSLSGLKTLDGLTPSYYTIVYHKWAVGKVAKSRRSRKGSCMALVVGNILKLTDTQFYLNQLVENIYFYRVDEVPTPPEGVGLYEYIASRFSVIVATPAARLQHNALFHKIIRVDNLSNGIDFFELAVSLQGQVAGEGASSFEALNFVLRRSTKATRNGSKRLGGLSEASTNANSFVGSASDLAVFEAALASPLLTSDATPDPFATPVIVGRQKTINDEGKEVYVLDLAKLNPIQSAGYTAVSTQRSRKLGKGK